jgi:hypothetical protein
MQPALAMAVCDPFPCRWLTQPEDLNYMFDLNSVLAGKVALFILYNIYLEDHRTFVFITHLPGAYPLESPDSSVGF